MKVEQHERHEWREEEPEVIRSGHAEGSKSEYRSRHETRHGISGQFFEKEVSTEGGENQREEEKEVKSYDRVSGY
ncbi:hypothetical protein [Candidatus Solincola sp.]|nr:hypothetical protein [Actinomycetota bacterium]